MNEKGVGDLALDILKSMQGGDSPVVSEEVLPEISDDIRAKLIGLSTGVKPTIVESTHTEIESPSLVDNSKFLEILETTIKGLEQLKEMTSVGMVGVNMAGPPTSEKPKKKKKSLSKKSQLKNKKGSIEDFLKKVEGKC